ncbi:hypothetical protein M8J75_007822 [Diaphorina citri]|nr:hypothetical protein M8J75_007822 [Diaphorina citri]
MDIAPGGYCAWWILRLMDIAPGGYYAWWILRLVDIMPGGYCAWNNMPAGRGGDNSAVNLACSIQYQQTNTSQPGQTYQPIKGDGCAWKKIPANEGRRRLQKIFPNESDLNFGHKSASSEKLLIRNAAIFYATTNQSTSRW